MITTTLFASNAAVLENRGPINAIKEGFRFILDHLSSVAKLGLLLIGVFIAASIIVSIITLPLTFASMLPMQQAMMECMSEDLASPENFEAINECVLEAQQAPMIEPLQIITILIGSLGNSIAALILLISTSLLFYRLRRKEPEESGLASITADESSLI